MRTTITIDGEVVGVSDLVCSGVVRLALALENRATFVTRDRAFARSPDYACGTRSPPDRA